MASMEQLQALATGGTAGLDAYKSAQADAQKNAAGALTNTLTPGSGGAASPYGSFNYGASAGKASNDALGSYINANSQGFLNAANTGVSNAQSQVGYDHSALDSYLAQNQAKLDEQRRESEAKLSLQKQQNDLSNQKAGVGASQEQLFAQLPISEQQAYIEGYGKMLQQQDLDNQVQQHDAALQSHQNEMRQSVHENRDDNSHAPTADQQTANTAAYESAKRMMTNGGPGAGNLVDAAMQGSVGGQAGPDAWLNFLKEKATPYLKMQAPGGFAFDPNYMQGTPLGPPDEHGRVGQFGVDTLRPIGDRREAIINEPAYDRVAATQFGWDPIKAEGTYASDPATLKKNANSLDDFLNYDANQARTDASNRRADLTGRMTDQYNGLSAQTGMDPSDIKRISGGALSTEDVGKVITSPAWKAGATLANSAISTGADDAWKQFVNTVRGSDSDENTKQALIRYYRTVFADNGYSTSVS